MALIGLGFGADIDRILRSYHILLAFLHVGDGGLWLRSTFEVICKAFGGHHFEIEVTGARRTEITGFVGRVMFGLRVGVFART